MNRAVRIMSVVLGAEDFSAGLGMPSGTLPVPWASDDVLSIFSLREVVNAGLVDEGPMNARGVRIWWPTTETQSGRRERGPTYQVVILTNLGINLLCVLPSESLRAIDWIHAG